MTIRQDETRLDVDNYAGALDGQRPQPRAQLSTMVNWFKEWKNTALVGPDDDDGCGKTFSRTCKRQNQMATLPTKVKTFPFLEDGQGPPWIPRIYGVLHTTL